MQRQSSCWCIAVEAGTCYLVCCRGVSDVHACEGAAVEWDDSGLCMCVRGDCSLRLTLIVHNSECRKSVNIQVSVSTWCTLWQMLKREDTYTPD